MVGPNGSPLSIVKGFWITQETRFPRTSQWKLCSLTSSSSSILLVSAVWFGICHVWTPVDEKHHITWLIRPWQLEKHDVWIPCDIVCIPNRSTCCFPLQIWFFGAGAAKLRATRRDRFIPQLHVNISWKCPKRRTAKMALCKMHLATTGNPEARNVDWKLFKAQGSSQKGPVVTGKPERQRYIQQTEIRHQRSDNVKLMIENATGRSWTPIANSIKNKPG